MGEAGGLEAGATRLDLPPPLPLTAVSPRTTLASTPVAKSTALRTCSTLLALLRPSCQLALGRGGVCVSAR